jgi:hypothetical protein
LSWGEAGQRSTYYDLQGNDFGSIGQFLYMIALLCFVIVMLSFKVVLIW